MADQATLEAQLEELQAGLSSELAVETGADGHVRVTNRSVAEIQRAQQIVRGQLAEETGTRRGRMVLTENGKGT